jgi:hypothetical protein
MDRASARRLRASSVEYVYHETRNLVDEMRGVRNKKKGRKKSQSRAWVTKRQA